jgi:formate C-acetyltransferase
MAEGLDWIATMPARTFWEACQQVMLYNVFLKVDNDPGVTSLGRFDQYTWPYLKKDLEEGRITMDEARDLSCFFLKINTSMARLRQDGATAGIGHQGQHTTIGASSRDGEDANNPVSYWFWKHVAP